MFKNHPWNPGYALPQNVKDEPLGRGVITTKWAHRGTIDSVVPDYLGSLGSHEDGLGSLSGPSIKGNTLAKNTLQGTVFKLGGSSDPIANFGLKGAATVMSEVRGVPKEFRKTAMRAILESIKPGLWEQVAQKARVSQTKHGINAKKGLEKAIAATLANHYVSQLKETALTKRVPKTGVMGLGTYSESMGCACSALKTRLAVSGWLSDIGGAIKSVGKKVVDYNPATLAYKGGKKVASYAKKGVKAAYNAGKKVFKKLGKLACAAANFPGADQAAAAAGAPGSTTAMQAICSSPQYIPEEAPSAGGGGGFPVMPVLLIGGAIAAYLMLKRG